MYRFAHSLASLEENSTLLADMLLHVQEKDKERFSSLLHTLIIMSKSINIGETNSRVKQPSKVSICYPPQHSSTTTNKTPSSIPKSNNSQAKFRIKTKINNQTPKLERNTKAETTGHHSVQR